jgi:iron complex transport system ATP-binding protein
VKKPTSVLAARSLHFSYGIREPEVLRGISVELRDGSVAALLGPNGSGKTTLLNLFLGWLSPTRGHIELEGKPLGSFPRHRRSRLIGLVPQEESMAFEIDVLDYVLLGRAPYLDLLEVPGIHDHRLAVDVIDRLGLMGLIKRHVSALSGGEKQLVVLARALVQDPRIFLFDEPLSHLDLGNTRRILRIIQHLREKGKSVIFTTHDPNAAAAVADTVVLLRKGRLLAAGGTGEVLTAERLSSTYDTPVEVVRTGGRILVPFPPPSNAHSD